MILTLFWRVSCPANERCRSAHAEIDLKLGYRYSARIDLWAASTRIIIAAYRHCPLGPKAWALCDTSVCIKEHWQLTASNFLLCNHDSCTCLYVTLTIWPSPDQCAESSSNRKGQLTLSHCTFYSIHRNDRSKVLARATPTARGLMPTPP